MNKTTSGRIVKRKLPSSAQVSKRPLLHPAIPSPYAGLQQQKVVYIGSKTPFLSAVKRAEKLLHLSDKRLVQAGAQLAKQSRRGPQDEIQGIAEEIEALKRNKKHKAGSDDDEAGTEEVVIKGTGKAISKVMELGLWFQQRDEYNVRLQTTSLGAVDDVTYERGADDGEAAGEASDESDKAGMSEQPKGEADGAAKKRKRGKKAKEGITRTVKREEIETEDGKKAITETRIRQLSVLEVYVSLR